MANSTVPSVAFLVSEEPNVLEALGYVFQELGCKVKCHNSMADCLVGLRSELLRPRNSTPASSLTKNIEQAAEKRCCGGPLLIMVVRGYRGMAKTVKSLKSNTPACEGDSLEEPTIPKGIKFTLAKTEKDRQQLSRAETKVLRLILDGKSNKEIAYMLHRSSRTMESHRANIMRKLGVDNVVDLVKTCGCAFCPKKNAAKSCPGRKSGVQPRKFQHKRKRIAV